MTRTEELAEQYVRLRRLGYDAFEVQRWDNQAPTFHSGPAIVREQYGLCEQLMAMSEAEIRIFSVAVTRLTYETR